MTTTSAHQALSRTFHHWWSVLTDVDNDGARRDRAALARLRRVDLVETPTSEVPDVAAALMEPAFRRLCRDVDHIVPLGDLGGDRVEDLVSAVAAVVRVRDDAPGPTARLLGAAEGDRPAMNEARFLALMRVATSVDLFDHARRLPALLKQTGPVGELGASLFLWRRAPGVRRNWARDYYRLDLPGREDRASDQSVGEAPADAGA